jgi:hypothetical protein
MKLKKLFILAMLVCSFFVLNNISTISTKANGCGEGCCGVDGDFCGSGQPKCCKGFTCQDVIGDDINKRCRR